MSSIAYGYQGHRRNVADLEQSATWRNLHPEFKRRFLAFTAASGYRIGVGTGWRSAASQDAERARRIASGTGARMAPSSRSWHCALPAGAIDVIFDDAAAQRWAHEHAEQFGLWFPASDEAWHVQAKGYPYGRTNGQKVPALPRIALPEDHPHPSVPFHHEVHHEPEVHRGMVGPVVTIVQTIMRDHGHPTLKVDGQFGFETEHAVTDLQRFFGMAPTGVVRDAEWKVLHFLTTQR